MIPFGSTRTLHVGLVYDARDDYLARGFSCEQVAEFDCEETIAALDNAIAALGVRVTRIGNARKLAQELAAGRRWDLVFNFAEGVEGRSREAQVPCLLELYGIPYTFSDPLTCAITLDKAVAKRIVRDAGIATPDFAVIRTMADIDGMPLSYPLFAKPVAEGTGKGITSRSCVDTRQELATLCSELLEKYGQPVLVEEYLPGREFTAGILGTGNKARIIGVMEIVFKECTPRPVYGVHVKKQYQDFVRYSHAIQPESLCTHVADIALQSYRLLECRDAGRVDIRCNSKGVPCFVEVNPLPGLQPVHSDLVILAHHKGIEYNALIGSIVESAVDRMTANAQTMTGE